MDVFWVDILVDVASCLSVNRMADLSLFMFVMFILYMMCGAL